MKKTLLLFGMVSSFAVTYAQQRLVLAESFSQASCGPCAAQNPAFNALVESNSSKIIALKYQVSWPGVDPMYSQNPTEIDARTSYYNVTGVPERVMDGSVTTVDQSSIDARYAVASPVNMTISHTINPGFATANITVTITAPAIWNPSTTVLQLAMIERQIVFATAPGSNGETEFHNVMRKMVPGTSGSTVVASNFASAGGSQTFTFTNVAIPSYIYNLGEIGFIAFVQNNTTKEIYQAGLSEPLVLPDYAIVNSLSVPTEYSCATDLTGAVAVLKNNGSTTITSATVNYQIDNGTVATAAFSGSIAPGGTSNFTIPTTTVSSGSHVLKSYLTNINNSGLSTPIGTSTTNFARISGAASTGTLVQNFSNSTFPYANYYVNSSTNDNWVRSTANTGCMKYNCFSYAAGKSGNAYIAPINMTTVSAFNMTFDVAYRQYATENDELSVFVSTNCGQNWTSVYSKSGTDLKTGAAQTTGFTPAVASDWRNESVDLSAYSTATSLLVKFVAVSDYGNNMYVDNINIGSLGLTQLEEAKLNVYPNPASEKINVVFEAENTDYTVSLTDISGRALTSNTYNNLNGSQNIEVSLTGIVSGNYFITVSCENGTYNKKVVIK